MGTRVGGILAFTEATADDEASIAIGFGVTDRHVHAAESALKARFSCSAVESLKTSIDNAFAVSGRLGVDEVNGPFDVAIGYRQLAIAAVVEVAPKTKER